MLKCENCNAFMQKALQKSIMVGISTFPSREDAQAMLESLLNHKLIACGQISSPIESIYLWKNQIKKEIEWKMTVKFPIGYQEIITTKIEESHPYENPQWIVSEMVTTDEYYQWVTGNCPWNNYSSGLVLTRETTRSPSFHWPRLRSNSTRSKRLRTFRFLVKPPGGLKLGCLLIRS